MESMRTRLARANEKGTNSVLSSARTKRVVPESRHEHLTAEKTERASKCEEMKTSETKLPRQDSNLDKENQNLLCYRYTTGYQRTHLELVAARHLNLKRQLFHLYGEVYRYYAHMARQVKHRRCKIQYSANAGGHESIGHCLGGFRRHG